MIDCRARMLAELSEALPDTYRVSGRAAAPEQIDPDTYAVRAFTGAVRNAPAVGGVTVEVIVWVTTAATDPATVDDKLDPALSTLLAVFLEQKWLIFDHAERDVMDDADGPRWHGYRFTLTTYAQITED